MTPSDKLFRLIKALSPAEKRYFSLFTTRHVIGEKNNFLRLFEAINTQEYYNERAILQQFAGEKLEKDISAVKVKLYNLILKCIREYRSGKSMEITIREMLDDIEFLMERGLYEQSWDILAKAKKLAIQYEENWLLYKIVRIEKLNVYRWANKNMMSRMNQLNTEMSDILLKINNQHELTFMHDQLFVATRTSMTTDSQGLYQSLEEFQAKPEDRVLSFDGKIMLFHTQALQARMQADLRSCLHYHRCQIDLWQERPHYIRNKPQPYMRSLLNYAGLCLSLKERDAFNEALHFLEEVPTTTFDDEVEKFQNIAYLQLLHALNAGEFERADLLVPGIADNLARYKERMEASRELAFCHNIAMLFFIEEKWGKALEWINSILDNKKSEVRKDILICAHLLEPVIHYELGNMDYVGNIIRNNGRYLVQIQHLRDFERSLLNTLRKLLDIQDTKESEKVYRSMQTKIKDMRNAPATARTLGLEELDIWIESKCRRQPITEIFRERL